VWRPHIQLAGQRQHARSEPGDQDRGARRRGGELPAGGQLLAHVVDALAVEQVAHDLEVLGRVAVGPAEVEPPHALDRRPMRRADAEHHPAVGGLLHALGLDGERHRMPRIGRHHGDAELDLRHLARDQRDRRERVDAEDLRQPVRGKAVLVRIARLRDGIVDLPVPTASVDADAQTHPWAPRCPHSLIES
jgi:hypothetical protein